MESCDITWEMSRFKEASRHLWNTFLMPRRGFASVALVHSFESIERDLLREIVPRPIDQCGISERYRKGPIPEIVVEPEEFLADIPVQFGTVASNGSVEWTKAASMPVEELPVLAFYDFFDWNPYGLRDFPCVRTGVSGVGGLGLIEARHCRFHFKG